MNDDALVDDGNCFACGKDNAVGLHLHFEEDGEQHAVRAQTVIDARYQGWRGITHGGIITTLVDDAMAHAGAVAGYAGVVAQISIRFRKPVPVGDTTIVRAWVTGRRRNVFGLRAEVTNARGGILATAEGSFVGKSPLRIGVRLGK